MNLRAFLVFPLDLALWLCVQMPVAIGTWFIMRAAVGLRELSYLINHAYLPVVVLRRRLRGEPLKQDHDSMLSR